jgi:Uri superfamily endonuclease
MPDLSEYFGSGDANALRRLRRWCLDMVHTKWRHAGLRERMTLFAIAMFSHVLESLLSDVAELDNAGPEPTIGASTRTTDGGS